MCGGWQVVLWIDVRTYNDSDERRLFLVDHMAIACQGYCSDVQLFVEEPTIQMQIAQRFLRTTLCSIQFAERPVRVLCQRVTASRAPRANRGPFTHVA
jgi:hypothetical protein